MSDTEDTESDTVSASSEEYVDDDLPASEVDEEEEIDEYEEAVERYAQLIREVPQDDVGGIVEIVEKVFELQYQPQENNNEDITCGLFMTIAIIVGAYAIRVYLS